MSEKVVYQPSGMMCSTCVHKRRDCSHLDFSSMRVIGTYHNGDKKVKCADFARESVVIA